MLSTPMPPPSAQRGSKTPIMRFSPVALNFDDATHDNVGADDDAADPGAKYRPLVLPERPDPESVMRTLRWLTVYVPLMHFLLMGEADFKVYGLSCAAALLFVCLPYPDPETTPFVVPLRLNDFCSESAAREDDKNKETVFDRLVRKAGESRLTPTKVMSKKRDQEYVIVGVGFVGLRILEALWVRGERNITAFSDSDAELEEIRVRYSGVVSTVCGDVRNVVDLKKAITDTTRIVYCTFAIIRMERMAFQARLSHSINVDGTRNVLEVCREARKCRIVVHTSTSNVFCVKNELFFGMNESNSPLVNEENAPHHYAYSKAIAERLVSSQNGVLKPYDGSVMLTASVRPCTSVFGYRDKMRLDIYRKTKSIANVNGAMTEDSVYVDNVVYAHLLLEERLTIEALGKKNCFGGLDGSKVSGQAFNVSNECALTLKQYSLKTRNLYRAILDEDLPVRTVPLRLLFVIGHVVEWLLWLRIPGLESFLPKELVLLQPPSFHNLKAQFSCSSAKAMRVLGYKPIYSVDQGLAHALYQYKRNSLVV